MAHYHFISSVVNREFVFGDVEREQYGQFMREYEVFYGVRVLTCCILSNHFHILVEVPERPKELPAAEELLRRLEGLSGTAMTAAAARQRMEMFRQAGDAAGERAFWD